MNPSKSAPQKGSSTWLRRDSAKRAFTLVETMIATVLLSMIILSILAVLIGSYRVAAKARYQDHARYVIKSLADQFLTQQTTDSFGDTLTLFLDTNATGTGMTWTNYDGSVETGTPTGLTVILGDNTGAPIQANVTRTVWYLNAANGTPTSIPQNAAAGYMLRGDFTISYSFPPSSPQANTLSQTVTVVRSVP
jgi:type II secretory pathway pseudopilin PulG